MTDRFADVEEPKSRNFTGLLAVGMVVAVFLLFRWSGSAPTRMTATVESAGTVSVARIKGGTRESAMIRLADGEVVPATVVSGGPLSNGDGVHVIKQDRTLGGPVYQVVGKVDRR